MSSTAVTSQLFRRVMGQFATGITIVTVEREPGQVHGMTANSFTSVSLDPPLVSICVDEESRLLSFLKARRCFGVSILKDSQQALSGYYAIGEQSPEADARLGIRCRWTASGIPVLEDALAQLTCNVVSEYLAGDHTIFLGEVENAEVADGQPLLYFRGQYRTLQP
jgi:flavin reductase (DIM6/NTAB) family NADH-FMN oxidoreductase RutF